MNRKLTLEMLSLLIKSGNIKGVKIHCHPDELFSLSVEHSIEGLTKEVHTQKNSIRTFSALNNLVKNLKIFGYKGSVQLDLKIKKLKT